MRRGGGPGLKIHGGTYGLGSLSSLATSFDAFLCFFWWSGISVIGSLLFCLWTPTLHIARAQSIAILLLLVFFARESTLRSPHHRPIHRYLGLGVTGAGHSKWDQICLH